VGRFTTEEEIDLAVAKIRDAVAKLRDSSPQWREYKASIAAGNVKAASQ
jgi:cysteine desulfurase